MAGNKRITGSCHCGATRFSVSREPDTVTRCSCTNCHKRGALWAYYPVKDFELETPRETVATYQWGIKVGKYNFCPSCGNSTFNETPDWSTGEANFDNPLITINARLLDDFDLDAVPVIDLDGRNLW
jgi:hypothetical protein